MNNLITQNILFFIIIFIVSILLYLVFIPTFANFKLGQVVRDNGPLTHLKKKGTATMGGIVMLIGFIISYFYIYRNNFYENIDFLIVLICFSIVGFIDDYLKIVKKNPKGLSMKCKLFFQIIISICFLYSTYYIKSKILYLPFIGSFNYQNNDFTINLLLMILMIIFMVGVNNGVNFTDGLDGLCATVTLIISVFFLLVSFFYVNNQNLFLMNISFCLLLVAFLIFNKYPAKIFMGDTGSLFLGGFVAVMAIELNCPIYILVFGFIYFCEVLSVIIQVSYFKITKGKRFFKMAPIHHHFEKCGFSENKIVLIFSLITMFLCIISFYTLGGFYGK